MSRSIKAVLLVIHPTRNEALVSAAELTKLFLDKKIQVYATVKISGAQDYTDSSKVDLALVLGGDGTMLRAAELFRGKQLPILGINLGHVGFLAEIERPSLGEIAQVIATGSFEVEEEVATGVGGASLAPLKTAQIAPDFVLAMPMPPRVVDSRSRFSRCPELPIQARKMAEAEPSAVGP